MKCGNGVLVVAGDTGNGKKSVNNGIGGFVSVVVGDPHVTQPVANNGLLSCSLIPPPPALPYLRPWGRLPISIQPGPACPVLAPAVRSKWQVTLGTSDASQGRHEDMPVNDTAKNVLGTIGSFHALPSLLASSALRRRLF